MLPGVEDEAFRDLVRAWSAAKDDLKQARQRLKSFLLAHKRALYRQCQLGPCPIDAG